jgi:hypothetical protein
MIIMLSVHLKGHEKGTGQQDPATEIFYCFFHCILPLIKKEKYMNSLNLSIQDMVNLLHKMAWNNFIVRC